MLKHFWLMAVCLLMVSCVNKQLQQPYGLTEEHAGYVPARISVVSCLPWPNGARYAALPLSANSAEAVNDSCSKFDSFVIEGFKDQPYMRGFSPTWVKKLLAESSTPKLLDDLTASWQHANDSCLECKTSPAFYVQTIAKRTAWLMWLNKFSNAVRNADAILIPFLLYSYEKTFIDRGLRVKQRGAAASLLLIDTNNGNLLWSGGREAFANTQSLQTASVEKDFDYPDWSLVYERLFTEDIWRDFPGRQVFR